MTIITNPFFSSKISKQAPIPLTQDSLLSFEDENPPLASIVILESKVTSSGTLNNKEYSSLIFCLSNL